MSGFTYATLTTAIQNYTEVDSNVLTSTITDEFIENAEFRILRDIPLDAYKKQSIGNLVVGQTTINVPAKTLFVKGVQVYDSTSASTGANRWLEKKDESYLQEYIPAETATGTPKYYADWNGSSFLIAPTPDASYDVELHYFYRPTSITESGDGTSWLGTNAELALLYGSLVEAYTFLKGEPDLMNLYNSRFQESLQWLKNLGEGLQTRDQYRYDRLRRDTA